MNNNFKIPLVEGRVDACLLYICLFKKKTLTKKIVTTLATNELHAHVILIGNCQIPHEQNMTNIENIELQDVTLQSVGEKGISSNVC